MMGIFGLSFPSIRAGSEALDAPAPCVDCVAADFVAALSEPLVLMVVVLVQGFLGL